MENKKNKTILFSIIGSVVLTASIIFFVLGLLYMNTPRKGGKGGGDNPPAPEELYAIQATGYTVDYEINDEFTFDGICYAIYSNSSEKKIVTPSYEVPDMEHAGVKKVTLTYTEGDITVNYDYNIAVEATYVDPTGDEAEENARIQLAEAQIKFDSGLVFAEYNDFYLDYIEHYYMSEDAFGYEYEYINQYGYQQYTEYLYACNSTYVKRFVNGVYVGYTYNHEDGAREYVRSKQVMLDLNAYTLNFYSNNGHNSIFKSDSDKLNELFARFCHKEYDPENKLDFFINIYPDLGQIIVTPDVSDADELRIVTYEFPYEEDDHDHYGSDPYNVYSYDFQYNRDRYEIPNYRCQQLSDKAYANVPDYLIPTEGNEYSKCYVQPDSGIYNPSNVYGYEVTEEDQENFTIGFISVGDQREDYIQRALLSYGYTMVEEGVYECDYGMDNYQDPNSQQDPDKPDPDKPDGLFYGLISREPEKPDPDEPQEPQQAEFRHVITISYQEASDNFQSGVLLVHHTRVANN